MTETATQAPPRARRIRFPHLQVSRLRFPEIGFLSALVSISQTVATAVELTYLAPCSGLRARRPDEQEVGPDGRHPGW